MSPKITYFRNWSVESEEYIVNGILHREDGPAYIRYYENGDKAEERFYINNNLHRADGPAVIKYYDSVLSSRSGNYDSVLSSRSGNKKYEKEYEKYYINGECHRDDKPAIIHYYESGKIEKEVYYINGKAHRDEGPAIIQYYENGNVSWEMYCHYMRGDTSGISYYKDGMIETYVFILNGKLHKEDGAAKILYHKNGDISEEFYYKGEQISTDSLNEYLEYVKEQKLLEYFGFDG